MSNFAQRLYDQEVNPPSKSWGRIAAALDAEQIHEFPSRLYNTTVAPPPAVWNRINETLASPADAASSPKRGLVIPVFVRYAAAAVVIIAVAVTAFFTSERSSSGIGQVNEPVTESKSSTIPSDTTASAPASPIPSRGFSNPVPTGRNAVQHAVVRRSSPSATRNPDAQYNDPLYAYEDPVPDIAERYVTLMTPDGGFVRMSKKLGNLLCCVMGQEQDPGCKSQLAKWQEEIATSTLGPGNVLDVLDLVTSLNEGTGL